jgi:hypothetical protein
VTVSAWTTNGCGYPKGQTRYWTTKVTKDTKKDLFPAASFVLFMHFVVDPLAVARRLSMTRRNSLQALSRNPAEVGLARTPQKERLHPPGTKGTAFLSEWRLCTAGGPAGC